MAPAGCRARAFPCCLRRSSMRRRALLVFCTICVLLVVTGVRPQAQLAAPGDAGVVMGHLHLTVQDIEAHRRFWTTLGGIPVQNGPLQLIQFPGVFVMLRQAESTGGTYGSV